MRVADRDIRRIVLAPFRRRHWRAFVGIVTTFDQPGRAFFRYILNRGKYPWRVGLRTPLGRVEVNLADRHDLLTVNEVFCRCDYGREPRRVVADIGANVGFASLFFLTRSAEARVWAFEPDEENVDRLRLNLRAYADRLTVTAAAVVPTTLDSVRFVRQGRYGRLARAGEIASDVPAASIGDAIRGIVQQAGAIDLVKIDTEGTEEELVDAIPAGAPISEIRYETNAGRIVTLREAELHQRLSKTLR